MRWRAAISTGRRRRHAVRSWWRSSGSRREFWFPRRTVPARASMGPNRRVGEAEALPVSLGWAVVGLGNIATRVAAAIDAAHDCFLAAVCSRDPGKAARFAAPFEAHAYAAFADVLDDPAVGAVYLSTPNALHFEQTMAALQAGKHVLVEKPMALAVSDAQRMERAAGDLGRLLSVGFHLRHHPVHAEIRRRLLAGEVGQVAFAAATFGSNWLEPPVDAWQMDPALA